MALQKAVTLDKGLSAPEAYYKIIEVRVGQRRQVAVSFCAWVDAQKREANAPTLPLENGTKRFDFKSDEKIVDENDEPCTLMKWAYLKLKKSEEFEDAVDA